MRVRVCVPLLVLMYYSRYLGRNTLENKYTTLEQLRALPPCA